MAIQVSKILSFISLLSFVIPSSHSSLTSTSFTDCLSHSNFLSKISILNVLYPPGNSSFASIYESNIQNLRFLASTTPKPLFIITPLEYSHVQATVVCSKQNGLQIRIRSGGHDYEGTSHISEVPFVLLDLQNMRSISIDIEDNSAWVESGATLGELYYSIAEKSPIHGFPAGLHPTVGIGGHFGGGGVGNLIRKYGLGSDNVIDARIIDVNGRILDKESMGTDLFWAIRGGGGSSFGVIVSWKIKLVHVPQIVTVFEVAKTFEQGAIDLIHKWQEVGHMLPKDFLLYIVITSGFGTPTKATFRSLFLGRVNDLLKMMEQRFPEIRPRKEDCFEMSWIESVLYFSQYPGKETIEALKNRISPLPNLHYKVKSDLVHKPLPHEALKELWKMCAVGSHGIHVHLHPYGGIMNEISESESPFPHRKGVIYEILYIEAWMEDRNIGESSKNIHMDWIRGLYEFMTPYVSKGPRGAIFNIKDLDLGANDVFGSSYSEAKVWGSKYFKNNFERLAIVKGEVDPDNFFHHQQSIPPLVFDAKRKSGKAYMDLLSECSSQMSSVDFC